MRSFRLIPRAAGARVQPDHGRGDPHDRRLRDQRHGGDPRPGAREPAPLLIDRSVNDTLAGTVVTSLTTLLAILALVVFGGPVIRGFALAMMWGVLIGTYSTVYVAAPVILHLHLRREAMATQPVETAGA